MSVHRLVVENRHWGNEVEHPELWQSGLWCLVTVIEIVSLCNFDSGETRAKRYQD